jgi:hypothetical protein
MDLQRLNWFEDGLIARFTKHPVFDQIDTMATGAFLRILLQRRFLSLAFTPVYDMAIDGLTHPDGKDVAREILREEYPSGEPSHREHLVTDLLVLGADRNQILRTRPTPQTRRIITRTFELVGPPIDRPQRYYDIQLLTVLRFWGEILIAEEYACLQSRMVRMGLREDISRFYWPHFEHDQKKNSLGHANGSGTHSDRLAAALERLLRSGEEIEFCAQTAQAACNLKYAFYDQFLR